MATYKLTILTCDRCEQEFDDQQPTAAQLREHAVKEGWHVNRHGGDFDVCPSCLAALRSDGTIGPN